jgi:hypothetical protein
VETQREALRGGGYIPQDLRDLIEGL